MNFGILLRYTYHCLIDMNIFKVKVLDLYFYIYKMISFHLVLFLVLSGSTLYPFECLKVMRKPKLYCLLIKGDYCKVVF